MKELIRRLSKLGDSPSQYKLLSSETEQQKAVSEGHVPVCIGEEMERFEVRAELLGHPIFEKLLQRSAQEYGYEQQGVLRIPCSISLFERVLDYLMEFGDQQELPDEIEKEILRFSEDN
ncbi:uncharacterized protein A4U43_C07F31650 [Asparagus officinalis]|uniref:Uncharacterized protein n=1 Tax=Asparagus officinalis TaxID=4686 RepID=A0A5P1EIB9_ASPOF|nr:auxin-responsive protein SAUR71-like [Asparagus officinalis]ONK64937.1 uncharacterized protein A4U43_C07F31650 [Asparagus officinalis]